MRTRPRWMYIRKTECGGVAVLAVVTLAIFLLALLNTRASEVAETPDMGGPIDRAEERRPVTDPGNAPWSSDRTSSDTPGSALSSTTPTGQLGSSVASEDDAERVTGSEPPSAITATSSDVPTPDSVVPTPEFLPRATSPSTTAVTAERTAPASSTAPSIAPATTSAPVASIFPTITAPAAPDTTAATTTSQPQPVPTVPTTTSPATVDGPKPVDWAPPGQARQAATDAAAADDRTRVDRVPPGQASKADEP